MNDTVSLSKSDVLADLAVAAVQNLSPDEAFAGLLDPLRAVLGVCRVHVLLAPQALAWFGPAAAPRADADGDDAVQVPTLLCRQVIAQGREIAFDDLWAVQDPAARAFRAAAPEVRFYRGMPLRSDSGSTLGALCVMGPEARTLEPRDHALLCGAARQVSIQLELRRALESARRADRYRARLNLLATQDFNEPLSRVVTVLSTLRQSLEVPEDLELLALAQGAADTLAVDLRRVFDATELSADRDSPARHTIELADVLADLDNEWAHRASLYAAKLVIAPTTLRIDSNRDLLARTLSNLINGALERKATTVRLQVRRAPDAVLIDVQARGGGARSGMSEADRVDVAHDLDALDPSTHLDLSITIAKRCCDVLGYRLDVATALDVGSDYTVRIPAAALRD